MAAKRHRSVSGKPAPRPPAPSQARQARRERIARSGNIGAELKPHVITAGEVRGGLPVRALDELAEQLNVERATLAQVLGTSLRTLQRKAEGEERLAPAASDRLARIARILELATHVLGESRKASVWLTSKSRALDGEIPLEMLDTDIGTQRVQQELRQIEFGMPL
jgi:putative toxin-antitoxin system antitoxin component (TIGR02293 family)